MRRIKVEVRNGYKVLVGRDLLKDCGNFISTVDTRIRKIFLVSETNVAPLYLDKTKESLSNSGFEVVEYVYEAGEKNKNLNEITRMLGIMAENGFTRTDAVVALGGGVTTDMAGFAASIFLRGIKVFQIATTLLAQVDASVGGKTGVDLKEGKNLVGAFHQPSLVICDVDLLKSLSDEVFAEGMAEVIKYAFISDKDLYEKLKTKIDKNSPELEDVVARCVELKAYVVEQDELDNGLRQTLNFGHTLGHAIERNSNFTVSHGYAVAKGMAMISRHSPIYNELVDMIKLYDLPYDDDSTFEDLLGAIMNDKKKRGSKITVVLVNEIGKAELKTIEPNELKGYL
ncbi:MAG: 3-dehydroquinate synthase [Clostridia bacterium]|nr:3-dehydroquinate synthase [Clostridia bacterium]